MKYRKLSLITVVALLGLGLTFWIGLGKRSLMRYHQYLDERQLPEFWQKFRLVNPLEGIGKRRAYTPKEMEILRWAVEDKSWAIRVEALAALSKANYDPRQRQEAIQLALKRLQDPHWVVRVYALDVLKQLKAKSSASYVLPLLNDPKPEVRKVAIETLQQLGYQVRE